MLSVLSDRIYRRLFLAQLIALLGTGFATIALALLAFELAGAEAGAVLGTALAIKMVAYVGVSPLAAAALARAPRRLVMVAMDLLRAAVALLLPFVTEIWQVYLLIFILQSASAVFTPTFQAAIPEVLEDEEDYTKALSLSRLAYDLENLLSPVLAAALLTVIGFHWLFVGTSIGFMISALIILTVVLPSRRGRADLPFEQRLTKGARYFLNTPRLRGLMAVNLSVAAAGAMVIVNTVVYVQDRFGLGERQTAFAMAAFGCGSMLSALAMPSLLRRVSDRSAMLTGAAALGGVTVLSAWINGYAALLAAWFALGLGYSMAQAPAGRLIRRSAPAEDRSALFAAQFALSHACWLFAYPVAGRIGAAVGLSSTALLLGAAALLGVGLAVWLWSENSETPVEHSHSDLPADHPHLTMGERTGPHRHRHPPLLDHHHGVWPRQP